MERALARVAGDVRAGQERNAVLKARLAVLAVMMRVLDEVTAGACNCMCPCPGGGGGARRAAFGLRATVVAVARTMN